MNCATLILNWNGGTDTIECLRSLLPSLGANDYLFVIDNGSTDNSVSAIQQYLQSGSKGVTLSESKDLTRVFTGDQKLYICLNPANLGFGGGNNTVLKQLSALPIVFDLVWLLNNDAFADQNSLASLKGVMSRDTQIAAAGSLILNYPNSDTIQCTGVRHYKLIGVSKLINKNIPLKGFDQSQPIAFDYLNGASIMLRVKALNEVGFFDERFFLYSEELDLQLRFKERGYGLFLDIKSVVRHKLSGGTSSNKFLFYYHYNASAVLLNRKHYSVFYVFTAVIALMGITVIRAFPSIKNIRWGFSGIIRGLNS